MNIPQLLAELQQLPITAGRKIGTIEATGKPLIEFVAAVPSGAATVSNGLLIINLGATDNATILYGGETGTSISAIT